jgi:alanine racemase
MLNTAIVNLSLLQKNALAVKSKLKNTKFCAVVKANAYGHGAEMVANALYNIADCFAVALVEEAVSLRLCGIDKDILVLLPISPLEVAIAVDYKLTLAVESKEQILCILNYCKQKDKKCKIHIKVNTGMNRLGVDNLEALKGLLDFCHNQKSIVIDGIFTHYGNPQDKKSFESATERFLLAKKVAVGYNKNITFHSSASGGFLMGAHFDMVRIGILLYGYLPFEHDFSVSPIMKVYAPVLKNTQVKKGEHFLYGNQRAKQPFGAGLVRCGYADGFPRQSIKGQYNNRCMDLCLEKKAFWEKSFSCYG